MIDILYKEYYFISIMYPVSLEEDWKSAKEIKNNENRTRELRIRRGQSLQSDVRISNNVHGNFVSYNTNDLLLIL